MEARILQERGTLSGLPLAEMDAYWEAVKTEQRKK
jgi:hypothetical protein